MRLRHPIGQWATPVVVKRESSGEEGDTVTVSPAIETTTMFNTLQLLFRLQWDPGGP